MDTPDTIKYFLYARKSTEQEDRQVLSIDSQRGELEELAKREKLQIVERLEESYSAKAPGREIFNTIIKRIENGEAEGIITWHPNRLSRNSVDTGNLVYLMDQNKLLEIRTPGQTFRNTPNDKFLLNLLCSQAKLENDNKGMDVKRGLRRKVEMGWNPGLAPSGYLNTPDREKGYKIIENDPLRFHLIKKAWELMLTGSYSPPKILAILNNEWGYRTVKRKRVGGVPLSLSGLYRIFNSKFYAGILVSKRKEYKGVHEPMVTIEEYERVQLLLRGGPTTRPKTHTFAYSGMIRCAECGCVYTAQTKTKFIKCDKTQRSYTYYNCTRRKKYVTCSQRTCVREEEIDSQIAREIAKITIPPIFKDWAIEMLEKYEANEEVDEQAIRGAQREALSIAQQQLQNLTSLRCRELIDDDIFIKQSKEIKSTITTLQTEHEKPLEEKVRDEMRPLKEAFEFAAYAFKAFSEGGLQTKRDILCGLGQNRTMKDGKLYIEKHLYLNALAQREQQIQSLVSDFFKLEPMESIVVNEKSEALTSLHSHWLRSWDSNPEPLR